MWIRGFGRYLMRFGFDSFLVAGCVLLIVSFVFFLVWFFDEGKSFDYPVDLRKEVGRVVYVESGRGSLDSLMVLERKDGGYKKFYAYSAYVDTLSLKPGPYKGMELDFILDEDRIVSCSRNGEVLCRPRCRYVSECRERFLELYEGGWVPSVFAFFFSMISFGVHVLYERRK